MPFSSLDDLLCKLSKGQGDVFPWQKQSLTVGVAGAWMSSWLWPGAPVGGASVGTNLDATPIFGATPGALPHGPSVASAFADGVTTDGEATLTSASAAFTALDVGVTVAGPGIVPGSLIASVNGPTSVTLDVPCAATASGVAFTLERQTKHLTKVSVMSAAVTAAPGALWVVDRLMHYPALSAATAATQTLTQGGTLPRYRSGEGVRAFLEVTTALGTTATATALLSYTNEAGAPGRALGGTVAMSASSAIARVAHSGLAANNANPFLPLAAGDRGMRSVESVRLAVPMSAGAFNVVLCKPLACLPLPAANVLTERDLVMQVGALPRIYDGAALQFLIMTPGALVAATSYVGDLGVAYG